jgi:uncharacterized membrane protein YhaH (DUF805 family)
VKSAIIDGFKRWKDYSGRSSRAQFWWFQLLVVIWPFIAAVFSVLGIFVGSGRVAQLASALMIPIFMLVIAPPFIAVSVRRMHDVGKSGWFNLVPVYSLYLHLQPAKELGRIPGWIFAEKTALVFVGLTLIPVLTDGVSEIAGVFIWSAIYLGIRFRNAKKRDTKND